MYIKDDELEDRLESPMNLLNRLEIRKLHNGGRRPGDKNIPPIMREIIAVCAKSDGAKKTAEEFDTTKERASLLSNGIISQHLGVNSDFKKKIDSELKDKEEQAHNNALDALLSTLGIVNEKAREINSPKLASKIATDMARVVQAIRPKDNPSNSVINTQQVLIYAPEQKHIATYEIVDIG